MEFIVFLIILIIVIFLWVNDKIKIPKIKMPAMAKKFPTNLFFSLGLLFLFIVFFSIASLKMGGDGYGFVLVFYPSIILFILFSLLTFISSKIFSKGLFKKDVSVQDSTIIKPIKDSVFKIISKNYKSLCCNFPANGLFLDSLFFLFTGLYFFFILFDTYLELFRGGCVGCGSGGFLAFVPFISFLFSYLLILWALSLRNNNILDLLKKEIPLNRKTFIIFSVLSFLVITFFTILIFLFPSLVLYFSSAI